MSDLDDVLPYKFKERELEILSMMAAGHTNTAIGEQLCITTETVRWYNKKIYSKLGTSRRTEAIAKARQLGLIDRQATPAPSPLNHNLPTIATPFLGRNREIKHLTDLLTQPNTPLITVLAPGGQGKTRLAIELGHRLIDQFTDGVYLFELASLDQADLIIHTVLQTLQLSSQSDAAAKQTLFDYCRQKKQLFIFDNFEHLLNGANFINELIQAMPDLRVVVTSRERLNLYGEMVYELTGLQQQADDLFIASAQAMKANVQIKDNERGDVQRIVEMVGGMPLAIILAAVWVDLLTIHEIAEEISHDLDILTTEMRNLPERQRSIRAVLAATWHKQSIEERSVCRSLSVFRGGFTREAANQVAGASLPFLAELVNKSMLSRTDSGRYKLHELLRQYAAEKLDEAGETNETRSRHLAFFLKLAEEAEPKFQGSEQTIWLKKLNIEKGNLYAALAWSLEGGNAEMGLRLAAALGHFWYMRGHLFSEGITWLKQLLAGVETQKPTSTSARAFRHLGTLAESQGDYATARTAYERSLDIYRDLGDQEERVAFVLYKLGATVALHQNKAAAQPIFALARSAYEEILTNQHQQSDEERLALSYNSIGEIARIQNDYPAARSFYEKSLALRRKLGDTRGIAATLDNLGFVVLYLGDDRLAATYFEESLPLNQKLGNPSDIAVSLIGFAGVFARQGQPERATRLFGAVEALNEAIHSHLEYIDCIEAERSLAVARTHLDEATFATAWAEGRAMTLDQAIDYAVVD